MKNSSRFLHINSAILLEYIINNDMANEVIVGNNNYYFNNISVYNQFSNNEKLYVEELLNDNTTNNKLKYLCAPTEDGRWFIKNNKFVNNYHENYMERVVDNVSTGEVIPYDTIRLHVLSGYSFKDVYGIMLNVKCKDKTGKFYSLANWLYRRADNICVFTNKPFVVNNRVYDKYIDLKIPAVRNLSQHDDIDNNDNLVNIIGENGLNIINASAHNIMIDFSFVSFDDVETVYDEYDSNFIYGYKFLLNDTVHMEIPFDSPSDDFNIFIKESQNGNYITFYTTWKGQPITNKSIYEFDAALNEYTNLSDDGLEYLYNSDLADNILSGNENKWMITHEIVTQFYNNEGIEILSPQIYTINQTFNSVYNTYKFNYRPIIEKYMTGISYITFEYTAKLINKFTGTQILRKGALTTFNPFRYYDNVYKLNISNSSNKSYYKVYNKIIENNVNFSNKNQITKNKYIKVFYNASDIIVNDNNNIPISINRYGGVILLNLKNNNDNKMLDLMDAGTYVLVFEDINKNNIEIPATYSNNMNLALGQLEFNISPVNADLMKKSNSDVMAIRCKNIDGSSSTVKEIKYLVN